MNIRADQITTITFQPTMQKKLFKKVPSEVMLIKTKGGAGGPGGGADGMPITKEALESKEKGSWDKAKKQMLKFAKDNNITVHEDNEMWTPPRWAAAVPCKSVRPLQNAAAFFVHGPVPRDFSCKKCVLHHPM